MRYALIVAGGHGTRMGTEVPKQFLLLSGKPMLMHSISAFFNADPAIQITVVLPPDQIDRWQQLCDQYHFNYPHSLVSGGNTRFQSVKNGLLILPDDGLVAIHDGARPLILPETILRLFEEASPYANAIPVISPKDSLRWADDQDNRVINRDFVKIIQTPQIFELNKLQGAYVQEYNDVFTDDATVWEQAGNPVHLAEGQESNIKVTRPEDLVIAEALFTCTHIQ